MMFNMNYDIIVIGGGAAGCFAAVCAGERGLRVLLIEHGRLMHKLSITGKGRCNLTNNCDTETLLLNVKTNARFLQGSFSRFGSADTMAFFEELGVKLKTERGNRVFPASDSALEVVGALSSRINSLGIEVISDRAVEIMRERLGVRCEKGSFYAPKVILATGGMSYPKTGSTGDGYKLAAALGHNIIKPKAALVPIETHEDVSELAGLTLKNVRLTVNDYSEQGELLFTHFGLSGPLALTASMQCTMHNSQCTIKIDLKPALDEKTLDARLLRDFGGNKNKQLINALDALLPKKLIPFVISAADIQPDKQINAVTAAERGRLLAVLKAFPLTFKALRPIDEAVITDGGVDVREINPKNMESKLIRGLHFAGEIIDVAALTGGFNLQIAFSTAYAAAAGY
jgi:hypothetical protein